jgi:hypothetical protein
MNDGIMYCKFYDFSVLQMTNIKISELFIIISDSTAKRGLWPSRPRSFVITHDDAPRSV